MTLPVVLLDVDGPLADFSAAYLASLADVTGVARTVEAIDRFAIHECPFFADDAAKCGFSVEELRAEVEARVTLSGFCSEIPVQPGAQEAVRELATMADVYALTTPWHSSRTWSFERTAWLWDYFGIRASRVVLTQAKQLVRGDVLVDDKSSHVAEWGKAWPAGTGILFDMHHNKSEGEGLIRGGWAEVLEAVRVRRVAA